MATIEETVAKIVNASTWDQRVAQIRLVETNHGTGQHTQIFADVARQAYVPHLAPDFAYINESAFYERDYFTSVYTATDAATDGFARVDQDTLVHVLMDDPRSLLVFRTILGLTHQEFAHCTTLVAEPLGVKPVSASKVKSMEQKGSTTSAKIATVVAATLSAVLAGELFGDPGVPGLRVKQDKLDTVEGWTSVEAIARDGVPYADFLHQRHYGGAFRQVLDATSTLRGNLLEDTVEKLFQDHEISYIRTGAHNQSDIEKRFEIRVEPAPDFVVYDSTGLRAMLECKLVNDGGTARDKAPRFERLRQESLRLGGVPVLAVLAGLGWARVNDTLGPVVRDTEGRVFTLATLPHMLEVAPFPALMSN